MKLEIRSDSANYVATVINLPQKQKVEGLDNLVKVTLFGNDCLVSKDEDENLMYLFFPAGSQLSEDFCKFNNLYRETQANADPNKKGFFELNRRVKAIKFKGVTSTGFVIPAIQALEYLEAGYGIKVGDEFNSIGDYEICRKYFVPGPTQSQGKGDKASKINTKLSDLMVPNQFRFHDETGHLAKNLHQLHPDDIIVITDKWHGSSCILSRVLINKKKKWWQNFFKSWFHSVPTREYGYIYSSGKPKSNLPKGIIGAWTNNNQDYYISNIWKRAFDDYKHALEDGISLYGELVGFTEDGGSIQKRYDYGCSPDGCGKGEVFHDQAQYKLLIYRITYTKPDGNVIEFTWSQIKNYCKKYSLEHVPEFYYGRADHFENFWSDTGYSPTGDSFGHKLYASIESAKLNLEKDCCHCKNRVPAEGIVLRIDSAEKFQAYKLKSKKFLKHESEELDEGLTNMEDSQ